MTPSPITVVFIRKNWTQIQTHGRPSNEDGHMHRHYASVRQRMPNIVSNHDKLGKRRGTDFLSEVLEEINLPDICTSGFWPPILRE